MICHSIARRIRSANNPGSNTEIGPEFVIIAIRRG